MTEHPIPKKLEIDTDYLQDLLMRLLSQPSPTGRTDEIMRMIGEEVDALGLPARLTRRGVLQATLAGEREDIRRAVIVHSDTIGCMVRDLKDNGRLEVIPVGTWSARFAEGARVKVFNDVPGQHYTGTILPLKSSGHAFDDEVNTQPVAWNNVEVRLDERVSTAADLADLGIAVGDFVAVDSNPVITPTGFVNARHLDDKAGVAAVLAGFKAVVDAGLDLPVTATFVCTVAEEVGLGATNLGADVAEAVSVDAAVCAPGQQSREDIVNIAMHDMSGPFDYHLTRRMTAMCEHLDIPHARDIFTYYRSDVAAALESGAEMRAALVAFGTDASHGWERTHLDGLERVAQLIAGYLQVPFIFAWDEAGGGPVEEMPEQEQEVGLVVDPT